MEFPEIWTGVPYCAEPLRKKVLSLGNAPGRGCREEHEFRQSGPGGPVRRNQQDLFLIVPDLAQ